MMHGVHPNNQTMHGIHRLVVGALLLVVSTALTAQTVLPVERGIRQDPVIAGRLKVRLAAHVPRHLHASILRGLGLEPLYPVLPYERSLTAVSNNSQSLTEALRAEEVLLRSYVVTYASGEPPEYVISRIGGLCSEVIECCSPVYVAQLAAIPDDPRVPDQRLLNTIRAFDAWDVEGGSGSIVIGISDSGVLQDHEDLKDALDTNKLEIPDNGIDDDDNGYIDDYRGYNFCTIDDQTPPGNTFNPVEGHGTAVAGICGAVTNNGIGIAGVAGSCKIWPLKTMPNTINGIVYGYESLMYCALNGIQVANCSWGSTGRSCVDESVIRYVIARGTAIVAAAGNHHSATPFYPASYGGVLSVGVTDPNDNVISMSGHGPTVDIMAPGQQSTATSNDGTYGSFCCTSGSSPIAAGVVGLVRAHYPKLSPLQACAVVRESAAPHPWNVVEAPVNPDLLPYGRLDALQAVTFDPDSLPSIEWDSVHVHPSSGTERWGVGDTIQITLYGTNILAGWVFDSIEDLRFTPSNDIPCTLVGLTSLSVQLDLKPQQQLIIRGIQCVITRSTDTTVYLIGMMNGHTKAGEVHTRPVGIAIVPEPAFRTLQNDVLTVSVGDRGRLGNTDIERGQGAGLVYRQFCGQLYEGGLMVAANGKVVDAVRGAKSVNDHFHPVKRYVSPDSLTAIFTDADAPDSLRLGIQMVCTAAIGMEDTASIVLDMTLENTSDSVLYDLALGWFCDWDLGTSPGHNDAEGGTDNAPVAVLVKSAGDGGPAVWCLTRTYHTDAVLVNTAIDNATTYGGFDMNRKYGILHGAEAGRSFENVDVATVSGVYFREPLPPHHQRSIRQVFVIDSTIQRAQAIATGISTQPLPQDTLFPTTPGQLGTLFPNPSASVVTVPVKLATAQPTLVSVYDVQGRSVISVPGPETVGAHLITLDVSGLASGTYQVQLSNGTLVSRISLVVLR